VIFTRQTWQMFADAIFDCYSLREFAGEIDVCLAFENILFGH
jgi:hypothetical protein